MKNEYIPQPLDLSKVVLPEDVNELLEMIAKNVHETWAESRIKEGWVYGKERNDEKKTTPCLVPYEELPEIEKEYDRNTALATLKTIIKCGYRIQKDSKDTYFFRNGRTLYKVVGDLYDRRTAHVYILHNDCSVKKEVLDEDVKYLLLQVARSILYQELFAGEENK